MYRHGLLLALALLSACSSAPTVERTPDFAKADRNQDGQVALAEWLSYGGNEVTFMAVDPERKGFLDESKFLQALRMDDQSRGVGERQQINIDEEITRNVSAALNANPNINGWNIQVESYQRNVQLAGQVRTQSEKLTAEKTARSVSGVKAVFNNIVIRQ